MGVHGLILRMGRRQRSRRDPSTKWHQSKSAMEGVSEFTSRTAAPPLTHSGPCSLDRCNLYQPKGSRGEILAGSAHARHISFSTGSPRMAWPRQRHGPGRLYQVLRRCQTEYLPHARSEFVFKHPETYSTLQFF